jgi:hypothetical protein
MIIKSKLSKLYTKNFKVRKYIKDPTKANSQNTTFYCQQNSGLFWAPAKYSNWISMKIL